MFAGFLSDKLVTPLIILLLFAMPLPGCDWSKPAPKPLPRVAEGVSVENLPVGGMTNDEVNATLADLARQRRVAPRSAGFDDTTGGIVSGQTGRELDAAATSSKVFAAFAGTNVNAVFTEINPSLTEADLKQAVRLGAYNTRIIDTTPARVHNIRLAAKQINNALIEPGYEFSFNRRIGEVTEASGYKPATVFGDSGRAETGIGGGICQVSSTLYNAVLAARLTVTERHPHSLPVSYVPTGLDATTADDKDLRFLNSTRNRLVIRVLLDGGRVMVDIWRLPPQ